MDNNPDDVIHMLTGSIYELTFYCVWHLLKLVWFYADFQQKKRRAYTIRGEVA